MGRMQRDRRAIRQVLERVTQAGLADIALSAGEGLAPAINAMVEDGDVVKIPRDADAALYRLRTRDEA